LFLPGFPFRLRCCSAFCIGSRFFWPPLLSKRTKSLLLFFILLLLGWCLYLLFFFLDFFLPCASFFQHERTSTDRISSRRRLPFPIPARFFFSSQRAISSRLVLLPALSPSGTRENLPPAQRLETRHPRERALPALSFPPGDHPLKDLRHRSCLLYESLQDFTRSSTVPLSFSGS